MDQGTALRTLVVVGLVGAVIAAMAMAAGRPHEPTVTISSVPAGNVSSVDLKSCATLERTDPVDPHCAALWEANRLRFFGKPEEGATP